MNTTPAVPATPAPISAEHAEEVRKHVRVYIKVFLALLVGTALTVGASYIPLGTAGNVTVALCIAVCKAALVAGFFMHLVSEKRTIYTFLVFTAIFFAGLMFLTLFAMSDHIVMKNVS